MFHFLKKKKEPVKELNFYSVAKGEVISMDEVNDPVFSKKMMGEGYGVRPTSSNVYSPVSGVVMSIFPTKHAIGLKTACGLSILLHLGIDTVELKGAPFNIKIKEGDKVTPETLIAIMDLEKLAEAGKCSDLVVVITNTADQLETFTLSTLGNIDKGEFVATAIAK